MFGFSYVLLNHTTVTADYPGNWINTYKGYNYIDSRYGYGEE